MLSHRKHCGFNRHELVYVLGHPRTRQQLLPTAVPSVFFWSKPAAASTLARRARAARRHVAASAGATNCSNEETELSVCDNVTVDSDTPQHTESMEVMEVAATCEVLSSCESMVADVSTQTATVNTSCCHTQTDEVDVVSVTSLPVLSFANLESDEQLLHYYTGLETAQKLNTVFATLGPAVNHLTYFQTQTVTGISPLDQFILMLAKLRQDIDYLPLSRLCGVSEFTARNIFVTWINFCARQWSEINCWPDKDLVQFYTPEDFKVKFPTTRVIVDGTEIPIQKPSNPLSQRSTFSSYKNRNTLKILVGSTPGGLISYLSPAYGGATSDRQIVERSNLPQMCDANDSIMADKGFNVQDLFAARDIHVNIPTFFRKKNRMSGRQVVADRKISSKRVHIERIIGLMKTYKMLTSPLPASEAKLGSHIVTVCAKLCNFRNRIVSKQA